MKRQKMLSKKIKNEKNQNGSYYNVLCNSNNFFECAGEQPIEAKEEDVEGEFANFKFEEGCTEDALVKESVQNKYDYQSMYDTTQINIEDVEGILWDFSMPTLQRLKKKFQIRILCMENIQIEDNELIARILKNNLQLKLLIEYSRIKKKY